MRPWARESEGSTPYFELRIQLLHLFDDPTILQFAVRKHGRPGESLFPYVCGLSGDLIPDMIPKGMIEGIGGLGEFSVMNAEGETAHHWGTIEKGDR